MYDSLGLAEQQALLAALEELELDPQLEAAATIGDPLHCGIARFGARSVIKGDPTRGKPGNPRFCRIWSKIVGFESTVTRQNALCVTVVT